MSLSCSSFNLFSVRVSLDVLMLMLDLSERVYYKMSSLANQPNSSFGKWNSLSHLIKF